MRIKVNSNANSRNAIYNSRHLFVEDNNENLYNLKNYTLPILQLILKFKILCFGDNFWYNLLNYFCGLNVFKLCIVIILKALAFGI